MSSGAEDGSEKHPPTGNMLDHFDQTASQYFADSQRRKRILPSWLDHFNPKDLKVLFKCSLAAWVMTLLMLINPSLKVIGQAVFFGVIVIFIAPPSGIVLGSFLAGVTVVIGIGIGWAWGVITMKAALATRPEADLKKQYRKLQQTSQELANNTLQASGQSSWQQVAIFDGVMLDTRVTVTYFCMLCLLIYLMARLRSAAPKLALVQVFSTIVSDVFLLIAPLLPTFVGTLPRSLIIPAVIAMGLSLACNILFFPQSTSHIVMDNLQDVLKPMNGFIGACLMQYETPTKKMDIKALNKIKKEIIQSYQIMEGNLGLLALDVSMCRWSTGDIKSLQQPLRSILGSFVALLQDHIARLELGVRDEKMSNVIERLQPNKGEQPKSGDWHFLQAFELRKQLPAFSSGKNRERGLRDFSTCSQDLGLTLQEAIYSIMEALRECNSTRWFGRLSSAQLETMKNTHIQTLAKLRRHRKECSDKVARCIAEFHRQRLLANSRTETGEDIDAQTTNSNVLILVLEERFQSLSFGVEAMLDRIIQLEGERQRTRVWLPGSLKNVVPWALEKTDDDFYYGATLHKPTTVQASKKARRFRKRKASAKDIDTEQTTNSAKTILEAMTAPGSPRGAISRIVVGLWDWFSNNDGLYALRMVVITVALGSIAVNTTTAGFFYREKGLWAVIMAQISLNPYTADFLYNLICKLIGTILGGLLGLVAWYIGAGDGPGNPYGIAAIMIPVIMIGMWIRLFTGPALLQGAIMAMATVYLVVSYSWIDTHIPSYGNPGVGYSVFWRRLLLVIIGFGAAIIVQIFPRPPSAARFFRQTLASTLTTVKNQYALLKATRQNKPDDFEAVVQETGLSVAKTLTEIEPRMLLTKFELSTSNISPESLVKICQLCMNLNGSLAQLMIYSTRLPDQFRDRFFRASGAVDDRIVADVMALLTLAQHALLNGEPLPAALPGPLMERSLTSMKQRFETEQLDMTKYDEAIFTDPAVRKYVAATAAFIQFLGTIDELLLVLKSALGETAFSIHDVEA